MKHFLNFFKYSLFLSLVVAMVSCGGDDDGDEEDTTLADQAELLVQGTATVSSAKLDGGDGDIDWTGFTVTFSGNQEGGTYTTNADASKNQTLVWPTSGTWKFGNNTGTIVTRDDDLDMSLSVGATSLELTFDVPEGGISRALVVDGTWVFKFDF